MKIWIDESVSAPDGYIWCKNINEFKEIVNLTNFIQKSFLSLNKNDMEEIKNKQLIEIISIKHNSENYTKILNWFKENKYHYRIQSHLINKEI